MILHSFIVIFFIIFSKKFAYTECSTKVWLRDLNVYNPNNWIKTEENCNSFIMSENNEIEVNLKDLKTHELVLPKDGIVSFTSIEFVPTSKCIKLKPFNKLYYNDYHNWATLNENNNLAVPHTERVPCEYDDVKLPSSYWRENDRLKLLNKLYTRKQVCADKSGCLCGNDEANVCLYAERQPKLNCQNPIMPIGFCNYICGSQILLFAKDDFDLQKLKKMLEPYSDIDTHTSKVFNGSNFYIQVILTEKNFKGDSVLYGVELYDQINENDLKVKKVELKISGGYYIEGMSDHSGLKMVFGTLLGVILTFIILISYYNTGLSEKNIFNRFNFRSRNLPNFNGFFTNARYNIHRSNLTFENQSLNSSVMSLEKSFDNPMYQENETPCTSTYGSMNKNGSEELKNEGHSHENPLYDLKNGKFEEKENILENIAEENEQ